MKILILTILTAMVCMLQLICMTFDLPSPPQQAVESASSCPRPPVCKLPRVLGTSTCSCVCPHVPLRPCIPPMFYNTETCQCDCLKDEYGQCLAHRNTGVTEGQTCRAARTATECYKATCDRSKGQMHRKQCV